MNHITFPAHTQARMDAARAAKAAKAAKPVDQVAVTEQVDDKTPALQGHIVGLNSDSRLAIMKSEPRVKIAYGPVENPLVLIGKANLAMLRHYIPTIVNNFYVTSTEFGNMIILPDKMSRVTERGLKQVIQSMQQEIQKGSYHSQAFTKNPKDDGLYMIRPRYNVVDMIHALNALRAFGLDHDAGFLAQKNGPIMLGLKLRAQQWTGGPKTLERFIETMNNELLDGQDRELLSEARAVWKEWIRVKSSVVASKRKA
ncbi:hypothetical protein J7T55_002586 [Diaporthe amygdali]|uniref:uncharacterized protein n=1 Tax=Phomopsis amygdali TaxID=1214568 RepID=UPI0022FEB70E|nr:uncharacterized protein J7T55_002586 [Diaporthe amygdali]KAJ0122075.1 hypothetical protein J7T55_002586 [Diaporthe amygdali]